MASFKKLLIAGAFLIGIVTAFPTLHSNDWDTSVSSAEQDNSIIDADASITKRQPTVGHQMLQWSPDGTILYLICSLGPLISNLPQELQNMIRVGYEGTPAQVLLESFHQYIFSHVTPPGAFNLFVGQQLFNPTAVTFGGVYDVGGPAVNMWGFAFSFAANNVPNATDLQGLVSAIQTFAQQDGGIITVVQRANGFFNPANIGAGISIIKRTCNDNCPVIIDPLQYATTDVPQDIDYNTYTRWAEPCIGKQT